VRYIVRCTPTSERLKVVRYLRACLPELEVVWDSRRDGMETFLRAMDTDGGTGAVHLEDDVVLTRDFRAKAELQIAAHPESVINFFGLRRPRRDAERVPHWDRTFTCSTCFSLPPGFAPGLAAYYPAWLETTKATLTFFDYMISEYLRTLRQPYWYVVPSLVQHLRLPSQIRRWGGGDRSRSRQSPTFVDPWLPKEVAHAGRQA
jgi:hypothetical protein